MSKPVRGKYNGMFLGEALSFQGRGLGSCKPFPLLVIMTDGQDCCYNWDGAVIERAKKDENLVLQLRQFCKDVEDSLNRVLGIQ